jgi:hypothetical protein
MITTLLGMILLLIPFLLIWKFEDKKLGFAYILSFLIAFHLIVAVVTQALGIFSYNLVLGINGFLALIILIKTNFKQIYKNLKLIKILKIDWILIFVIIVVFIQLYSVHYNYTGEITTVHGFTKIENMKYPYPYFSDEWVAVSLIQYSIGSGKLPLVNPLWHNSHFVNFELPFHSFISEIILLLDLNPLTQYTILTIFTGILLCLLVYFILRTNGISRIVSGIASLSVSYIVNGANLPGIWNLIPLTLGIISFLLGFLFMSLNKRKMSLFMAFLTLIFYPPLFVLHSISLIFYFAFSDISKKEKIKSIFSYLIICALVTFLLFIFALIVLNSLDFVSKPVSSFFDYARAHIFYKTFTVDAIPYFAIWKVIPILTLLLAGIGFFKLVRIKRKLWLVAPVLVGLIYWVIYSFVLSRFIIEYARIVVTTSILIIILSGFGLHYLLKYLRKFYFIRKYRIIEIAQIIILLVFFVLSFSYTQRDNWKELRLYSVKNNAVFIPGAPANMYLNEDDLKLFNNIKEKNFLSLPWKGLVIGTATHNYPLITKESTLTNTLLNYIAFMESSCEKKSEIAKQRKMGYIYSEEFNCEGFEIRGVSGEGLHLYEFTGK